MISRFLRPACARSVLGVLLVTAAYLFSPASALARGSDPGNALRFANVQVSHDTFAAHSEPAIAEDPKNKNDLVAGSKFFSDPEHYRFKIGTYFSRNGGRSWHDSGLLPGFGAYAVTSDISLAFSPNGKLVYACVLAESGPTSGVFVSRSRDGGATWSNPVAVFLDTTGATFSDKPWITVDGTNGPARGSMYVAWNLDSGTGSASTRDPGLHLSDQQSQVSPVTGVVVARSTTHGSTFSAPVTIAPFTHAYFAIGALPAVGPNGDLYVAFLAFRTTGTKNVSNMQMVVSADHGLTFSRRHTVAARIRGLPDHLPGSTFRNISLPTFAVSPTDGALVLAWADTRYGDADVLAMRSTNAGATWSSPARVNHDRVADGKDQFQPELAVAPDGVFTCSWFDRRYDPKDRLIDVDIAQSLNGGLTFGHNLRVTRKSWNPSVDAPVPDASVPDTFIGDYQALAVDDQAAHPLWNDTQNGVSQQIRTAVLQESVFLRSLN